MLTHGCCKQGQHRAYGHTGAKPRLRCHKEAAQHLYELGRYGKDSTVLAGELAQLGAHRRVPAAEDVDVRLEHADLWAHLRGPGTLFYLGALQSTLARRVRGRPSKYLHYAVHIMLCRARCVFCWSSNSQLGHLTSQHGLPIPPAQPGAACPRSATPAATARLLRIPLASKQPTGSAKKRRVLELATSAGAAGMHRLGAVTSHDRTHPLPYAPSVWRPQTEPYLIGQAEHGRSVGHVGRNSEVAALARHQLQQPPPRRILRRLGPLLERLPARSTRLLEYSPWVLMKKLRKSSEKAPAAAAPPHSARPWPAPRTAACPQHTKIQPLGVNKTLLLRGHAHHSGMRI